MSDQQESDDIQVPTEKTQPHWIARGAQKIKYKFQERRAQKKNEKATDRAARQTAYATCFIAVFALVTIVVGLMQWQALHDTDERIGQQVEAMRRQLTLMESDQRPWIKIADVRLAGPVRFTGDASTVVSIEAINVGRSVAFNVFPSADMYVFIGGKYSHAVPTDGGETCNPNTMSLGTLSVAGESIFPSERISLNHAISIERKEIDATLKGTTPPGKGTIFFVVVCFD